MCFKCDYKEILSNRGLEATENRIVILEIVGNSSTPLNANEIFDIITRSHSINRVTVYRILDLLVENNLLERISTGERSYKYGLAPNENHQHHPHFYCKSCGYMECLSPDSIHINIKLLERTYSGVIDKAEIRLDGTCKNCLKTDLKT